ncbi:glycosyltransferase [Roseobacter sp. EG26]|uniref:glycosyltransferase n=1 Tax=Roseobacter sp. EG26 TaxID=3412477 RepID=UPI003CE51A07
MAKLSASDQPKNGAGLPSVAVVVLTYNQQDFIEACLESLAALDYPALKIWVLDDGSSDATAARVTSFIANASKPIEFIQQENSGGHISGNLQTLLDTSRGDYIMFMSGDDMLGPAFPLGRTIKMLEANSNIAFMLPRAIPFAADPTMPLQNIYLRGMLSILETGDPQRMLTDHLHVQVSRINLQGMVVRRDITERMGGFDTNLVADDYAFSMRIFNEMIRTGMRFHFDPEALWLYRLHDTNVHRVSRRQFTLVAEVVAKYIPSKCWSTFKWDTMGMDTLEDWYWAQQKVETLFGADHAPQIIRCFANASIKAARRRRDRTALSAFARMKELSFRHRIHALLSLTLSHFI